MPGETGPSRNIERGSSGSSQLSALTDVERNALRALTQGRSIPPEIARSIAAKVTDPNAFAVRGDLTYVNWDYVLDNFRRLFRS